MWESGLVGWQMLQVTKVSPFDLSWNTVLGSLMGQHASHCVPVIWLVFAFIYNYEIHLYMKGFCKIHHRLQWKIKCKIKNSKVVVIHNIKTYRGSRGVATLILGRSIMWKWVVTSHPSCFTPMERTPSTLEIEAEWPPEPVWMFWRRENILSLQGMNLGSSTV